MKAALFTSILMICVSMSFAQIPGYIPTDGLVAWYPFNGNANDESGNGNDGTEFGSTYTADRYGDDASACDIIPDTYVRIEDSPTFNWEQTSELTLSVWVCIRNADNTNYASIISKWGYESDPDDDFDLIYGFENDNLVCLAAINSSASSGSPNFNFSSPMVIEEWHHLIIVVDANGSTGQLWKDGELVDSDVNAAFNSIYHSGEPIFIGRVSDSNVDQYYELTDAKIDDIAIWNRTLTEEEILAVYNGFEEEEIVGCLDTSACNYNPLATIADQGLCYFATAVYDCAGNCQQDADNDGICDQLEGIIGAQFCGENTYWDPLLLTCVGFDPCPADINEDGFVTSEDLLLFLVYYGDACE